MGLGLTEEKKLGDKVEDMTARGGVGHLEGTLAKGVGLAQQVPKVLKDVSKDMVIVLAKK